MGKLESNKKKKEDALYNTLHIWLFVRIRSQVFLLSSIL